MKGFAHPDYAQSLAEFGLPRELPECGGWLLERPIPGHQGCDAMGCYPLFVCRDWSLLHEDLRTFEGELVSVSMVTDPFGKYDEELLQRCFDVVIPFKEHFVADLGKPVDVIVSRHHRKYARKALRNLHIEICTEPIVYLDEWTGLYGELTNKFHVSGVRAFSKKSFEKQLRLPGAVMFRALYQGETVAAHLVYAQDDVCYGHLVGDTPVGHDLLASYALYLTEVEYFSDKAGWLDWGAGAGIKSDNSDGLTQYKQGWSTGTRTSYFCGRILDRKKYAEIVSASGMEATNYFPAYRNGEFG